MNKVILYVVAFASLCLMMVGCSDETFNQESGNGTGYLRLALGSVNVELSSTSRADAGQLPADLIPETSDFMVDIKMNGKSVDGFPKPYTEITEDIELMAGSYSVIAYSGDNNDLQDKPYFYGSSTAQINPGQPTETEVNAVLANAMITPSVSESLQNHYSEWTLTLKVGETSLKLADNTNSDGYLFAKAGTSVSAVFEGVNALENETSHEWDVVSSVLARTKYVIQCDPDLSVFSNIKLTATATHTYNENSLTGTDVTLNVDANGAPLELIDGWNIQLLYNNKAIRTCTSKPENGTLMDVTKGWPYVPQGSSLMASIHLSTGEMINLTSATIDEIPQPEFSSTVSANTSYSVYKNSGADAANATDGSSIFDINATANIASEILTNPNYSEILKVTYTTDSGQNLGELSYGTVREFNSLAWQKHALKASISFDGVVKESNPIDCHVTGLPYVLKHPANDYGWYTIDGSNIKYNNDCIYLEAATSESIVGSPAFHIPEILNFSLYCQYEKNNGSLFGSYTFSVEMLKSIDKSRNGVVCSHKSKKKGRYDLSGNGSFTSELDAISCRYDYRALGNSVDVISMQINYR
ncbi:DUF4493 domain-containing protein [Bacteroides caecigallinarum]|uniref:DUF4493 domain-containing protein n=1 Tax=Bacteroides caecigallinarum TaxID=1411144 RepID=UPI00195D3734|nr:DUF4493 domain-containing protein [Bacteroides caecigallinarum]MBM6888748.1 DUF4493 domain-containing protein [Bacteroides caecigallinarum]